MSERGEANPVFRAGLLHRFREPGDAQAVHRVGELLGRVAGKIEPRAKDRGAGEAVIEIGAAAADLEDVEAELRAISGFPSEAELSAVDVELCEKAGTWAGTLAGLVLEMRRKLRRWAPQLGEDEAAREAVEVPNSPVHRRVLYGLQGADAAGVRAVGDLLLELVNLEGEFGPDPDASTAYVLLEAVGEDLSTTGRLLCRVKQSKEGAATTEAEAELWRATGEWAEQVDELADRIHEALDGDGPNAEAT